jgi:hypothetical protein
MIAENPIGRELAAATCRTPVSFDLPHYGEMADVASDNIAFKFLHAPMLGKKNTMAEVPKAL